VAAMRPNVKLLWSLVINVETTVTKSPKLCRGLYIVMQNSTKQLS